MKDAAWLGHKIMWVNEPSIFELERLGLSEEDVILIEDQVSVVHNSKSSGDATIIVNSIDVVSIDEVNNRMSYRIRDQRFYNQMWDAGGVHLANSGKRRERA